MSTAQKATCSNGVYKTSNCADDVKYMTPKNIKTAFYTSWSYVLWIIATVLMIAIYIPIIIIKPENMGVKIFSNVIAVIILFGAINSIGVFITSQFFVAYNMKNSFGEVDNSDQKTVNSISDLDEYAFGLSSLQQFNQINFQQHIVPAIVSIVSLTIITCGELPGKPWISSIVLAVLFVVFVIVYMSVPTQREDGRTVIFFDKINYVYNNPNITLFIPQVCVVLFLIVVIPLFSMNAKATG